jgi:predicted nucleic acid-binding protein
MLVDTSVWIDHVRRPEPKLIALLNENDVQVHPFVIGELACGHLGPRHELTLLIQQLPSLPAVDHEEAMIFLERHALHGQGVGWVDLHLLASTMLASATLWTRDQRMGAVAHALRIEMYE